MHEISKPMDVSELNIQPPISGKIRLSDDMQQTLALLTAYGADRRRPLRCSESGVLHTASPRIKDVVHYTADEANDEIQGDDVKCTEVIVIAHPDNAGRLWARPNTTATVNNAVPLDAKESTGFTLDNLSQLQLLIVTNGDKAIVMISS